MTKNLDQSPEIFNQDKRTTDEVNEDKYRALFRNSHVGMIIADANGDIEEINEFASKMFGYQSNELVGKKVEILIPESIREKHVVYRESYNRNPIPRKMQMNVHLMAVKKTGTPFHVEVGLSSYKVQDNIKVIAIINETTEKHELMKKLAEDKDLRESLIQERTEDLSQALQELDFINNNLQKEIKKGIENEKKLREALNKQAELNELKSRFVSMASHEFRTPLGGIMTSISLIARYAAPEYAEKREKHIQTIKSSVKHLTSILNDFLSVDKLEQDNIKATASHFLVKDLLSKIALEVQDMGIQDNPIVYTHTGEELEVFQDSEMLRNILFNLLSNAVKYSSIGKEVYMNSFQQNNDLVISVQDQGIGIPLDDQKYLFGRFFRATNAMTINGTGLGLNIVKKYLEYMNGKIEFTSKENVGSTFSITIPLELE